MSLGLYESRLRRRRRFWWSATKWGLVLGFILAAGIYAYRAGVTLARQEVLDLSRQVGDLRQDRDELQRENGELKGRLAEAAQREAQLREQYRRDVPEGPIRDLAGLVRQRLDAGVKPDRLAFLIGKADNPRDCDALPTSKRFLVQTPLHRGANDSVSFADNAITVTAEGRSATTAEGAPEAWFDAGQPIKVRFVLIGGRSEEVSGVLPLHHALVAGDYEHRFTVLGGDRGFIRVAAERCKYP